MIDNIKNIYYPRAGSLLTENQIMEFLNRAMNEVYKDISKTAKYPFKTVANTYKYLLPDYIDFESITKMELSTDTTITVNSYWQKYELNEEYSDNVQLKGYKYYNALDSYIGIYPIPTVTDQNINLFYKIKPTHYIDVEVTFDNTTDTITAVDHGLSNGDIIRFVNNGGALPAEIIADTNYYVVSSVQNTFKVSATSGGAVVNFTDDGSGTTTAGTLYNECTLKDRFHMLIVYAAIMEICCIGENPDISIYNMYQVKFNSMLAEARGDKKPTKTKAARWW